MENEKKPLFLKLNLVQRRWFNDELENIRNQRGKANNGEATRYYPHCDVYGNQRKLELPHLNRNEVDTIGYRSSLAARINPRAAKAQQCGPCLGLTTFLTTSPRISEEPNDLLKKLEEADLLSKWNERWDNSAVKRTITTFVETHGPRMRLISNIVGINFGVPGAQTLAGKTETSYLQHLAAFHLANELSRFQGKDDRCVVLQDPGYGEQTKAVLDDLQEYMPFRAGQEPRFKTVKDPEGLVAAGWSSFVLNFNSKVPVGDLYYV
jgi:hypothetical protein